MQINALVSGKMQQVVNVNYQVGSHDLVQKMKLPAQATQGPAPDSKYPCIGMGIQKTVYATVKCHNIESKALSKAIDKSSEYLDYKKLFYYSRIPPSIHNI